MEKLIEIKLSNTENGMEWLVLSKVSITEDNESD